jgi:hypothetical protein
MTPERREKLLLIGLGLAVAAELTWVAQQVRTEVIGVPQARTEGNPTTFTNNVIEAANK